MSPPALPTRSPGCHRWAWLLQVQGLSVPGHLPCMCVEGVPSPGTAVRLRRLQAKPLSPHNLVVHHRVAWDRSAGEGVSVLQRDSFSLPGQKVIDGVGGPPLCRAIWMPPRPSLECYWRFVWQSFHVYVVWELILITL